MRNKDQFKRNSINETSISCCVVVLYVTTTLNVLVHEEKFCQFFSFSGIVRLNKTQARIHAMFITNNKTTIPLRKTHPRKILLNEYRFWLIMKIASIKHTHTQLTQLHPHPHLAFGLKWYYNVLFENKRKFVINHNIEQSLILKSKEMNGNNNDD